MQIDKPTITAFDNMNHTHASAAQGGTIADTTGTSAKTNALNSATTVINVSSATAPISGQVLTATSDTSATWQTPSGLSWGSSITGTSSTGLTLTVGNSAIASTIAQSIVVSNTQSNPVIGLSIDTGTSIQDNYCLSLKSYTSSITAGAIKIDMSTTGTGKGINFISSDPGDNHRSINWSNCVASSNTGYGIFQTAILTGAGTGYGIYQYVSNGTAGGNAYGIYQSKISNGVSNGYGWYVSDLVLSTSITEPTTSKFFSLNNAQSANLSARTVNASEILFSRTNTTTSGTVADDFSLINISRTSIQNGVGGTLTAAGNVMNLSNIDTQTAGTLTSTVNVLKITQSSISSGAAIYLSTAGTSKTAIKIDSGFTSATAPVGASTYILIDIGGTSYKLLAQATA